VSAAAAFQAVSAWVIPLVLAAILLVAAVRRVKAYGCFVEGAKEGFSVALRIIPYLVAIIVAVGMFRASGAMDLAVAALAPVTSALGIPPEILPVAALRPLSGSGTLGLATELMKTHGPDSFLGRLAGTVYGSTETTFYVLAVYFGSVGVTRTRHAVAAGLAGDLAGFVAALLVCRWLFS
jgi:spore maturation protein B